MTPDTEQLAALRQLDEVLGDLDSLFAAVPSNDSAETRHSQLRNEAAQLYGQVSRLVGGGSISRFGQPRDAVQTVLGNPSLAALDGAFGGFYYESLVFFRSLVNQAIGSAEEMERRGRLAVSPDVAARWSWLIRPLERIRRMVTTAQPRFLNPLLQHVEGWPVYRLIAVIGTVGGFIAVIIVAVAFLI